MPETSEIIEELRARVALLETRPARPRGRMNMTQAAAYLGRSAETLRRWHLEGNGPPRKQLGGRNWSYAPDDLDAWIASRDA
jgi:hypothetical protein